MIVLWKGKMRQKCFKMLIRWEEVVFGNNLSRNYRTKFAGRFICFHPKWLNKNRKIIIIDNHPLRSGKRGNIGKALHRCALYKFKTKTHALWRNLFKTISGLQKFTKTFRRRITTILFDFDSILVATKRING